MHSLNVQNTVRVLNGWGLVGVVNNQQHLRTKKVLWELFCIVITECVFEVFILTKCI